MSCLLNLYTGHFGSLFFFSEVLSNPCGVTRLLVVLGLCRLFCIPNPWKRSGNTNQERKLFPESLKTLVGYVMVDKIDVGFTFM